jgi:CubicO group peptidase (beta-lactamase class C family)
MGIRSLGWAVTGLLVAMAGPALAQPRAAGPAVAPTAAAPASTAPDGRVPLTKADADAWLDGFMPITMARADVAGTVVVIVKDGKVLTERGYGYADVAAHRKVDPETTLFRPGSTSKLFTWTAVMQLVEQGKIDLDADVNRYLDFRIPPKDGKPVTMREIMTHTAGFEDSLHGLIAPGKVPDRLSKVLKAYIPARVYEPGTTEAYSNYATALAGYIVERLSGMRYEDYIRKNIFDRLGMDHSTFVQPLPANLAPFMSKGYGVASGPPRPFATVAFSPAGAASATGADMAKFMIAHLDNGGPLLKPETARMMHDTSRNLLPPLWTIALGFFRQDINGQVSIGHGGDLIGFHSYMWLFPKENVGLFFSMNSDGKGGASGPIRLGLFEAFADRYFPGPEQSGSVDAKTAADHARMMVGNYWPTRRWDTGYIRFLQLLGQEQISLNGKGQLVSTLGRSLAGSPRKWVEIAPFLWKDEYGHQRLTARVENGKVVRAGFDEHAPVIYYDPVPWYLVSSWLMPVFEFSLAILLLTALSWPISPLVRRHYGVKAEFARSELTAYRTIRLFAWLAPVLLLCWLTFMQTLLGDMANMNGQLDWLSYLLQILSVLVFFGLFAAAAWNLWVSFTGTRRWYAKLWSVAIAVAAFFILWVALGFKLISWGISY